MLAQTRTLSHTHNSPHTHTHTHTHTIAHTRNTITHPQEEERLCVCAVCAVCACSPVRGCVLPCGGCLGCPSTRPPTQYRQLSSVCSCSPVSSEPGEPFCPSPRLAISSEILNCCFSRGRGGRSGDTHTCYPHVTRTRYKHRTHTPVRARKRLPSASPNRKLFFSSEEGLVFCRK